MTILFKYIFKRFFLVAFSLTLCVLGILWLAQSLRYMDFIINNRISIGSFFSLILYLLPDLFVILSPISFAIAMLFCFHRLIITHELSAFRALGLSNFRISLPALSIAGGLISILICMNMSIVPASFQKFRNQQHLLQNAFSGMLLREGNFNTAKKFTVYIREHSDDDTLKGVFIYQPASENKPACTTMAESGHVYNKDNRLLVVLKKGQRQEYDAINKSLSVFSFDKFTYDLTDEVAGNQKRSEKPAEKSLNQLLFPEETVDVDVQKRFRVEAHQRILLPFLGFLDVLWIAGILLAGEMSRRYNRTRLIWASLTVLGFHMATMGLINNGYVVSFSFYAAYFVVFVGIFLGFVLLCRDQSFTRFIGAVKKMVIK